MFLAELTQSISRLRGIGPASARDLASLGVLFMGDLLRYYPRDYEDRKTPVPLARAGPGRPANTVAQVTAHDSFRWKKGMALKVMVEDETAQAALLCYGRNFLARQLSVGATIYLTGDFEPGFKGILQAGSFAFEKWSPQPQDFGQILPIYPLKGSLNQGVLRKSMKTALSEYLAGVKEEIPPALAAKRGIPPKAAQLWGVHFPVSLAQARQSRQSLIFEELFQLQVAAARQGQNIRPSTSPRSWSQRLIQDLLASLPFSLTPDQERTLKEIREDLHSPRPMNRLLQGETGSGKTLVGILAALGVIAQGRQAVMMAPTELLAKQHADNAARLLEPLGVRTACLSGDVKGEPRRLFLENLAAGKIDLALGTHALFSSEVRFRDLALAVVDEQHRFGVEQRRALAAKGHHPDLLLMTATPIPRTLAITAFGDLDTSEIKTMPRGRIPVTTHLARITNEAKVYDFVRRELQAGRQAYFVYPLIEESEKTALKDAETMYQRLAEEIFPSFKVALLHSRVDEKIKQERMAAFQKGEIHILAATSVVEVGVDVANASCMVIEHAERFGLSALHQLRGRVGRGKDASYCFLLYAEPLTEEGRMRMKIMKETNDGFKIAEEDLKIRGPGDMAGIRQSGFLKLRIADPVRDMKVLLEARREARALTALDPGFLLGENQSLRELWNRVPPFDSDFLATG